MSILADKLSDRKVLIFDVYGTLMVSRVSDLRTWKRIIAYDNMTSDMPTQDWESGIYDALKPLLSQFPASKGWSRREALTAFGSVETDLQSQFPDMLYADLLAKVHEVLEQRLKALSSQETSTSTASGSADGSATLTEDTAGTSVEGASDISNEDGDPHEAFGNSIRNWPIFPDTSAALHSLARHYKLVVLSNVDRDSFQYTHGVLSEGRTPADPSPYLYPTSKVEKYWHPQSTAAKGKSPWTLILTAQDVGCYKPSLGGFQEALDYIKTNPELLGGQLKEGEDVKDKVLVVAQSLPHDHIPASQLSVKSVWIDRQSAVTCNELPRGQKPWTWRFETLGEMAEAVEKEG